jgi:hypothetical protein
MACCAVCTLCWCHRLTSLGNWSAGELSPQDMMQMMGRAG